MKGNAEMQVYGAKIHEFEASGMPYFDDDGDQMIGFYYQWLDVDDNPIGGLIGPYSHQEAVESAATRAFKHKDF